MKLTITRIFTGIFVLASLSGCGAFSDETKLEIQMYGVPRAPESAAGDRDPQFQTYEVQSITLASPEGDVALLTEAQSFKIVDRPQIILDKVADDLSGKSFTGLTVVLSPTVVGGDNDEADLTFTLSNPTLALTRSLAIEEGKNTTFIIKANWANTIGSGAMTEPTFEITVN